MGQLTWQNVDVPTFGGVDTRSSGLFLEKGLTGIGDALEKFKESRDKTLDINNINKALQLTSPQDYEAALASGALQATPGSAEFISKRLSELQGIETTKINQQGYRLDNEGKLISNANNQTIGEGYKIDNEGKIIDNRGKEVIIEGNKLVNAGQGILNDSNKAKLDEQLFDFGNKKTEHAASPAAAAKAAEIVNKASNGTLEGLRAAQADLANPETIKLLNSAGYEQKDIDTLRTTMESAASSSKGQAGQYFKQANIGPDSDLDLMQGQQAIDLVNKVVKGPFGTFNEAREAIQNTKDVDPRIIQKALTHFDTVAKEIYAAQDPRTTIDKQAIVDQALQQTAPRETGAEQTLTGLLDQTEGAGDWDTLYGNAQREGGQFAGQRVSTKTIGELDAFAKSGYGNWVAGRNNGVTATPMGRFQIVNDTLQSAAKEMGLSPDTVFDANTQTDIFRHLANRRLASIRSDNPADLREAMRKEWAGLRNVDDATLDQAIADFRGAGPGKKYADSFTGPVNAPDAAVPGPVADATLNDYVKQLDSGKELNSAQNEIVNQQVINLSNVVDQGLQDMGMDDLFAGDTASIMKAVSDTGSYSKDAADVANELGGSFKDQVAIDQLRDDINTIKAATNLPASVVGALIKNNAKESSWIWAPGAGFGFEGNQKIDTDEAIARWSDFANPNAKTPGDQVKGLEAKLNQQRVKATYTENIQSAQKQVQEAYADYFNAVNRKQSQPNVDTSKLFKMLQLKEDRLKKYMDAANKDQLLKANRNAALAPAQ